jgi:hypothetical protein
MCQSMEKLAVEGRKHATHMWLILHGFVMKSHPLTHPNLIIVGK